MVSAKKDANSKEAARVLYNVTNLIPPTSFGLASTLCYALLQHLTIQLHIGHKLLLVLLQSQNAARQFVLSQTSLMWW
jgi:hypothetical protein